MIERPQPVSRPERSSSGSSFGSRTGVRRRGLTTALVAASLMAGGASTAIAAEPTASRGPGVSATPADGALPSAVKVDLGRGVTGTVNTELGTVLVESPGGLVPAWDSALLATNRHELVTDRYGLEHGWTWGTAFVEIKNGLHVYLPGLGWFEADASTFSGLAGYDGEDLAFFQWAGRLPARGALPEREYAFQIQHASGTIDYFDDRGDLIATIGADGTREDRVYRRTEHGPEKRIEARLERVVHADGAASTIDSSRSPILLITSASTGVQTTFSTNPRASFIGSTTFAGEGFAWSDFVKTPAGEHSSIRSTDDQLDTTTATLAWDAARPGVVTEISRDGVRLYPAVEQ